jgi:membrane protein implicated in regulation of membrane protease activity
VLPGFLRGIVADEIDRLKDEARASVRAVVRGVLLVCAALFLLLVSLLFVMLGAYDSMSLVLPHWMAGVIVALASVVFALLLLAAAAMGSRRRRSRRQRAEAQRIAEAEAKRREELQAAMELGASASAAAGSAAREFLRSHRPTSFSLAVSAFVAGLVAARTTGGRAPGRRRKAREERLD